MFRVWSVAFSNGLISNFPAEVLYIEQLKLIIVNTIDNQQAILCLNKTIEVVQLTGIISDLKYGSIIFSDLNIIAAMLVACRLKVARAAADYDTKD